MKKLLTILLLVGFSNLYSQNLIQTFVDRCTGAVNVFTVPMNGQATVVFYNKSRTFTAQEFQNGELRAWLEETYAWWASLNPCSTAQTNATTTQAVTQQTTQAATQAATAAVPAVPPVPASPPPTQSAPATQPATTNTTSNDTSTQNTTGNTQSSGSTDSGGNTSNTDTGSTGDGGGTTSNDSGGTNEGGSDSSGGAETEAKTEETKTEETKTEETKSEEKTEEVKEEKKEETKEESKEEKKEEEKSEEKEESKEEEKSEEEKEEEKKKEEEEKKKEKEEKKKKKKKVTLGPPIITANTAAMQGLDGTYSYASTFGVSRSSLMGDKTYGLNTMIWSNLKQFMLTANYSQVHINKEGRVSRVYSASLGGAKMFTTVMGMMNHSVVFLGKKGSASGLALGGTLTSIEFNVRENQIFFDELLAGASITGFYTKPIPYNRFTFSPMVAVSSAFMSYELFSKNTIWNKDLMIIGGLSTTFNITKRFGANLGVNTIGSTNPTFPVIWNFTIGSRFSF